MSVLHLLAGRDPLRPGSSALCALLPAVPGFASLADFHPDLGRSDGSATPKVRSLRSGSACGVRHSPVRRLCGVGPRARGSALRTRTESGVRDDLACGPVLGMAAGEPLCQGQLSDDSLHARPWSQPAVDRSRSLGRSWALPVARLRTAHAVVQDRCRRVRLAVLGAVGFVPCSRAKHQEPEPNFVASRRHGRCTRPPRCCCRG